MAIIRAGSTRAAAQPFVESGVRQGLSARQIQDALSSGGLSYRRTDFLADVRAYAQRDRLRDPLNSVGLGRRPSADLLSPARTYQSRTYKTTVELTFRSADTGGLFTEYRSISHDALLTRGQMLDAGRDRGPGYIDNSQDQLVDAALYAVDVAEAG